jgi:radical SAM protein with 4Fe4S-binding SPASM domain
MSSCNLIPNYLNFSRQEIDEAVREGKLLTAEMEFSLRCNFRCPYCYNHQGNPDLDNELTTDEIRDVILQVKGMGAKKIILLGGEPMAYPHVMNMVKFIREEGLGLDIFTNGYEITEEVAKTFYGLGINVVLKMNTFNENVQDMLAGKKGATKIIWEAFHNLKNAGYPSERPFLAISSIICRQNIDEIVTMWRWLREGGIVPYFEMITPQGNATDNEWLNVDTHKIQKVFHEIAEIDRKNYGNIWEAQPPLIGDKCLRHQFSCLITSKGEVFPCVGVPIPVGNIRKQKLETILKESEVVQNLKNFRNTIKGPCSTCESSDECYGCRGAAYQKTGDYLASDPTCWKNMDKLDEITYLPADAGEIIPHKLPMRLIDSLDRLGERTVDVTVKVSADMPFIGTDGKLDGVAFLEMMAQAAATMQGIKNVGRQTLPEKGFLLGCKKLKVYGKAFAGETIKVSVYKIAKYAEFGILEGTITKGDKILARGEFKIWHGAGNIKETLVTDMA